ncbi:MAG: serine/threonine-protein phosphatase [Candidatus Zixiibacteriota bacterium]|nr:MAG: serine/threonine-protein phosphatase [candidate division Zixibacteria bacterium]
MHIVDRHMGIAVADVAGKGIPAALIMASFRASLLAEIRNNYSIRTICEKVNILMCESTEPENFVTAVYAVLDANDHVLTYANCGHGSPILLRADGRVEYLDAGGPLMGVVRDVKYDERALVLQPGDIVLMYTDGATEVFDGAGNEFGTEGLVRALKDHQQCSAVEIREAIHRAVTQHAAPDHPFDDITMVVIKRLPAESS